MKMVIIANIIIPLVIFFALATWNGIEGDASAVFRGLTASYKMLTDVAIIIAIAFLITGQAKMLVIRHEKEIIEFLNGKHGLWGSAGAGIIVPTLSTYPIVQDLWQKGAAPLSVIFSIILSTRLINFQSTLFFFPFLGWELTALFTGVSMTVVVLFVLAAKALS